MDQHLQLMFSIIVVPYRKVMIHSYESYLTVSFQGQMSIMIIDKVNIDHDSDNERD